MKRIKKILLVISFLFSINYVSAQLWKEMMNDPTVNVYEVVQEAELYYQNVDKDAKGSGWKTYQRWLYENEPKFYPSGDRSNVDPYFVSKAYKGFLKNNPSATESMFNNSWEELGPYYIEQVTGHYSLGLGRVESFYADPDDTLRIYLGSRSGGFWKTIDGGLTWIGNTTDFLMACGVNTMTVSPTNHDSILINVRNSYNGVTHGIYRSVDAGDTWTITDFNPANLGWGGLGTYQSIFQVAYHPTVPGLVFVGTQEGLFRSSDNLSTWTVPVPVLDFKAIAFHPANPDIIYASTTNNNTLIYVSTDGGLTFNTSNTIVGNTAAIKLSTSAACPNCVYVGSSSGIWKSTDEGQNFNLLSNPGITNYGAYAVSDVNTNYMLFGDIDTHMSYDEGLNFTKVTYWSQGNANYNTTGTYVHADIRGSRCENGVFWVNTDGFLCKSNDIGVTWRIFEGQSIRENYSLGLSQSNHERTICGSQDNGTSIKTENSWIEFFGADGMEGIIHPLNDDWMIGSYQNGGRRRTMDGGTSQQGVTPPGQSGSWIAPLFYDPNDQMVVYHIGGSIYRSEDFGSNWTILGSPGFSGTITYATIAENNSNILVVARYQYIEKSLDGGNTFINIKGSLPNNSIRDVAFDPNDDNVIIVVYGTYQNDNNKVFITTDQGQTWQNISYNMNNIPIRSVVIDHTDASTIYLGTEIGVYKKAMADNLWTLYNPDLPNMTVLELEVMYGSNTLRAATWGRGLWEYTLDGRQSFPSILTTQITDQPTDIKPLTGVDQFVTSTIYYDSVITNAYVEWSINTPVFGNVISMTNTIDSTWVSDLPLPDQPIGTKVYFKVFAVGSNGDTTETYKFMYEVRNFENCQSYGNMSYATGVTLVDFNEIYNATGKTQPYTDYSDSISATVVFESAYDLNVNVNTDGNYTIYAKAWIDWNHDADFEDIGEDYDLGTAVNTPDGPTSLSPLNIAVPLDARAGITTMRVSAKYNSAPEPCETGFDGEVEDYSIIINKIYLIETIDTIICSNDSIFLEGAWQNTAGIYYDTIYVSPTTDSLYITTLSIYEASFTTDYQFACDSLTWIDGITYYTNNYTATYTLTNVLNCDSVITLNLTINYSNTSEIEVTACNTYTVPSGDETYTESGTYMDTIPNIAGCDSIMTIYLDVIEVDTSVTVNSPTLTSNAEDANYQWIDCETMQAMPGDTNQSFTANNSGIYAVIVTKEGCIDTSACYQIIVAFETENDFGSNLTVFPNPTTGAIVIDLGTTYSSIHTKILSLNGLVIGNEEHKNSRQLNIEIEGPAGFYFLEIIANDNKKATIKVIKE